MHRKKIVIGVLLVGCMILIIAMVNENNKLEYIKSDNLCEQQPVFLAETQEEKYLLTFKGEDAICYKKIDNSVSFIGVDKGVITLFNNQKKFVKSLDMTTYEEVDERVKLTEPQISKQGKEYAYTYMVDNLEHTGSVTLDDEKITLIDVN